MALRMQKTSLSYSLVMRRRIILSVRRKMKLLPKRGTSLPARRTSKYSIGSLPPYEETRMVKKQEQEEPSNDNHK